MTDPLTADQAVARALAADTPGSYMPNRVAAFQRVLSKHGYWIAMTRAEERRRRDAATAERRLIRAVEVAAIDTPYSGPALCQAHVTHDSWSFSRCDKPGKWLRTPADKAPFIVCGIHHRAPAAFAVSR